MREDGLEVLEPWKNTLEERLHILNDAKNNGKKVVVYYVEVPDSMTFRYRCYNTFQATMGSNKWQAVYFFSREKTTIKELLSEIDLFILGRQFGNSRKTDDLIRAVKAKNIPLVLDIDDLIFDKKYFRVVLNTIGQTIFWNYWVENFTENRKVAERMDGFLVTNDFLGKRIEESFDKPYQVIKNSLDQEQIRASDAYLRLGLKNNNYFKIGYFSGSSTHENDLEMALPEVLEFMDKYPKTKLRVVGWMEFDERARRFLESGRIERIPPVDFRKLQRLMCEVDVNIAPLVINDFTNCKSELKFFEAAAVETTTIASPTYTFKKAIKDGENGFLAQPGEWYDKLEYLYQHPEENRKIAKCAKKYALKHYYGKEFLKEVEAAYDYFVNNDWGGGMK